MNIRVKQRDISDCGAACLASVARFYNLDVPVARIRQHAGTDVKGTNVAGMLEAAVRLGFEAKGVKGTFESLFKIPLPAIAHIIVNAQLHHYVVIYKINKHKISIMDPADGKLLVKKLNDFREEWTGVLILLAPDDSFVHGNQKISLYTRFYKLLLPHHAVLVQALFGALIYTLLGLSMSIFVQKIVDFVLVDGNRNLLNLMSAGMFIILFLQIFIGTLKSIFIIRTGQMIDARLILGYYKHLLKLPQQFFDTMRVGEITSRIGDAVKIRLFINDVSINLAVNFFMLVFAFTMMFTYYWKLALYLLIVIPLYSAIYLISNRLNNKVQRKLMENSAELESQLVESLNSVGTIKRFGLEEYANQKTEMRFVKLLTTVYKSGLNAVFSGSSTELVSHSFTIILLWVGAGFVLDKQISPGELLSFYTLIGYFTGPVSSFVGMNKTVQDAIIASDRLFEIMDMEQESEDHKFEIERSNLGNIRFVDVSFRYGSRVMVFDKLNLEIPYQKMTGIVGESGSGKSTLMSILQNIYPVHNGHVFIGDSEIKYISNSSLRQIIAVVPQKIELFAADVSTNISIGDDEPDMKKILGICTMLGITQFIDDLPYGFQTQLGENGASLSGGQKQRIAIARALYRDPEILILDEASSSLDPVSERYVQNAIDFLLSDRKTVIVISHRLSSIQKAGKIIVLKDGKVVEEGKHAELIAYPGEYYHLWSQQMPMEFRSLMDAK
ncbi:MAG: peptidase C39 [Sphingobacteriales bacterium 17-39-43]|uniref:peptidase domain-containing ABC transporter n=1 Tax=Daejeonella sp. TaxID=2805397 RepID=UPI000BD2539C|nr:peptidase domain-containing ABC transporter [Daejeonella sp.]OYZ31402.1 MAG: peptidase C39 [Sphingobacteriales bacterium 16-39-50]OZA24260.1 MAG: peptidase C39 [Sphingobacteriales bacterium 17-39-43]OZA60989.1 MAG: peptidase C39 [Sphingobacteriales bacterium 39-40-5]HQT23042.1 peptidase domain-containing ABC transporter [Daejeonella sp.]HQT57928.1 peptidase domain-containing ABC transporter [Daejeonella sp.]